MHTAQHTAYVKLAKLTCPIGRKHLTNPELQAQIENELVIAHDFGSGPLASFAAPQHHV